MPKVTLDLSVAPQKNLKVRGSLRAREGLPFGPIVVAAILLRLSILPVESIVFELIAMPTFVWVLGFAVTVSLRSALTTGCKVSNDRKCVSWLRKAATSLAAVVHDPSM